MNYKDVVNRIQESVERHKMLIDFGYGQVSDIKTRSEGGGELEGADYPYLFLNPTAHQRTQQQITYNFNMIVMDMAREEEAHNYQNFLNIQSDCIQYIDDIVARLYYHYQDKPEVSMDLTYTPFYERFQDDLAGATATLSITVPNSINECIAPFNPEPAACTKTLTVFSDSTNEFEYVRDPDDTSRNWRWEMNTQEDDTIGMFSDQWFSNAVTGDFEFYVTQTVRFVEPVAGEVLPQRPVLRNLFGGFPDVEPTCDSGNWPTTWSAEPITYTAKYNITLNTLTTFGVIGFEDPAEEESAIIQEVGGTLTIGFEGVIPAPIPVVTETTVLEFTQPSDTTRQLYKTSAAFVFVDHTITGNFNLGPYSNFINSTSEPFQAHIQLDANLVYQTTGGFDPANYQLAIYNSTSNEFFGMTNLPATDGVVSIISDTFTLPVGIGNYYLTLYEIGTPNPQDSPTGLSQPLTFNNGTFKINVIS